MDLAKPTHKLIQILLAWLVAFGVCAFEPDETFLDMFQKELDNRALAGKVVPALAEHHGDSEQGRFWASSYSKLERLQWPVYEARGECYGIRPSVLTTWVKARLSILFAMLFPDAFVSKLADSTKAYASELEMTSPPSTRSGQAFWDYVVAQERAQVQALNLAAQAEFDDAISVLNDFVINHSIGRESVLDHC